MTESSSEERAMDALVAACPSFATQHAAYLRTQYSPGEARLPYAEVGELVRHVIGLHQAQRSAELTRLFAAVEELHRSDDPRVAEFAIIGFLESMQNVADDPEQFTSYLGPLSLEWWNKLNQFWQGAGT